MRAGTDFVVIPMNRQIPSKSNWTIVSEVNDRPTEDEGDSIRIPYI